ncbi:MAG TPA: hypothetical protein PKA63_10550 [Oligoflexia bacterium]|nr:hypothetical protein [Oligoflexia bacterium]HMP49097.1 hypothetical protein [Oligoflexia bacterium]
MILRRMTGFIVLMLLISYFELSAEPLASGARNSPAVSGKTGQISTEKQKDDKEISDKVEIYIPTSGETHSVKLRKNQSAIVYVFLSSLGDPLDAFMVSLVSNSDNKLVGSVLSGSAGEVSFSKISAGSYTVYVNRRVREEGEFSSVKVGDVRLKAYP